MHCAEPSRNYEGRYVCLRCLCLTLESKPQFCTRCMGI